MLTRTPRKDFALILKPAKFIDIYEKNYLKGGGENGQQKTLKQNFNDSTVVRAFRRSSYLLPPVSDGKARRGYGQYIDRNLKEKCRSYGVSA